MFSFSFSFNDRDSTTFFDTFHYCVLCPYVKRFSDIRRSWLRIVTDVIIFCIHGISLLNKIKDQNLEFEKQLSTSSITEYFYFFFYSLFFLSSPPSTVTHISFILQRHSHENLAGITLLTFQELLLQRCEGEGVGGRKKKNN